jgi:hypothetical protein
MMGYNRMAAFESHKRPMAGFPADFFTIKQGEKPYMVKNVLAIEPSIPAGRFLQYRGYLAIDEPGVYTFKLDSDGGNQLLIGDVLVAGNNVIGAEPSGKIELNKGYHPVVLNLAASKATLLIKTPDSKVFVPARIGLFARPVDFKEKVDGGLLLHLDGEAMDSRGVLKHAFTPARAQLQKGKLVDGLIGKAMKLTGQEGSWLEIHDLHGPENALSIACWVRIDKENDAGMLNDTMDWTQISAPRGRLRRYELWAYFDRGSSKIARFDMRKVGAEKKGFHHIALTYDANTVKLYVDGKLRAWETKDDTMKTAYMSRMRLFEKQDITLDEVSIYNRTLTAQQVAEMYAKHNLAAEKSVPK